MRIAVMGAGSIGTTIARRWQAAGHTIVYAARDPQGDRYRELAREAEVADSATAIGSAEVVLLAIPGGEIENLLTAQRETLDGKILVDATNHMGGERFHHLDLFEQHVPTARVYRAFNTLGWENFDDPRFGEERADLFYAGPDGEARSTMERLIGDVGLRPVYVGAGGDAADLLDGITRLWFTLALRQGHGRHLAFRTLGLPDVGR